MKKSSKKFLDNILNSVSKSSKSKTAKSSGKTTSKGSKTNSKSSIISAKSVEKTVSKKGFALKLISYSLLWVVLLVSLFFSTPIEKTMNKTEFNFSSSIAQGNYKVHFIDVGQGDCSLIQLPDNKNMLIDSGPSSSKNAVLKYLNALDITTIDYFIITHTDSDHVGNAVTIFNNFDILNVYIPKVYSNYEIEQGKNSESYKTITTVTWSNVTKAIYSESCLVDIVYNESGLEIKDNTYNYDIDFYTPTLDTYSDINDYSPIMMVNLQGMKYVFTGDASTSCEEELITEYASLIASAPDTFDCCVLKVGHHGSDTSTSSEFLNLIRPEYAVISVGKDNKYGHPTDSTITNLTNVNCEIKRTDVLGSIVMSAEDGNVVSQSNYNYVSDLYLEWKNFVIAGGVVLLVLWFAFFKVKRSSSAEKKGKMA